MPLFLIHWLTTSRFSPTLSFWNNCGPNLKPRVFKQPVPCLGLSIWYAVPWTPPEGSDFHCSYILHFCPVFFIEPSAEGHIPSPGGVLPCFCCSLSQPESQYLISVSDPLNTSHFSLVVLNRRQHLEMCICGEGMRGAIFGCQNARRALASI